MRYVKTKKDFIVRIYIRKIVAVVFLLSVAIANNVINAQSTLNIKKAANFFENGEYQAVINELGDVLARNDRDVKANYYVGAASVCLNVNIPESIRRLKYAQVKNYVADSYFYLGRAYQLNYEFELAVQTFDKFLKSAKNEKLITLTKQYRQQCENSVPLASKIFNVKVIDKYRVTRDSVLDVYTPSKEVGQIQHNSDFFESDIDPQGILYRTERGDAVYFSLPNGAEKEKLYKIERLLDGWGEMVLLNGLTSEGNDMMPIMMTDGTTMYFTSDREGGMGGLDIYRSTYDIESRTFTEPVNMGVPFNSAFDDFLFVGDEFRNRAWFASNRETAGDTIMVYEIVWDDSVIRSFAQNTDEIRAISALKIDPSTSKMRDNQLAVVQNKQNNSIRKELKKFEFVVNDSLTYTQWEHFRSNDAKVKYSKAFSLQNEKDSLSAIMAEKRKMFMNISSDDKRNELISEILKIERSVYGLEDEVDELMNDSRHLENAKLEQQIEKGEYVALSSLSTIKKPVKYDWNSILQAEQFEMCEPVLFANEREKYRELYEALFSPDEQVDLQQIDSMYVWAGILIAESQKLQEKYSIGEVVRLSNAKGNVVELSTQEVADRRDMLMAASAQLYDETLDKKFDIFDDKYEEAIDSDEKIDFSEITELRNSASYEFSRADKANIDNRIKSKKIGMTSFVEAMERYQSHVDGSFPLPERKQLLSEPTTVTNAFTETEEVDVQQQESVDAEQSENESTKDAENKEPQQVKDEDNVTELKPTLKPQDTPIKQEQPIASPVAVVVADYADASKTDSAKPIYRIQLGAFRNKPDATSLQSFGIITKVDVLDKGLSKYFAGAYKSYSEALENLPEAQRLFAGAFIVAFHNGKQIKLSEAQKIE